MSGEPKPLIYLSYGLIAFSLIVDGVYGLFNTHLSWRIFLPSVYEQLKGIAQYTFVLVGVSFEILAWKYVSRYGYWGILVSIGVFIGFSYAILWYLGVN